MKKYYLLGILLFLVSFSEGSYKSPQEIQQENIRLQYGDKFIIVGTINNLVGKGEVKVKPDIIITEFELKTEGNSLDDASDKNAKSMKEFKDYLMSIGVKSEEIETSRYTRSEGTVPKDKNEKKDEYRTEIRVQLNSIDTGKFYDIVDVLEKEGIGELTKVSSYDSYYYTIKSPNTNKDSSKKMAKEKYDRIENSLKMIGVTNISILDYKTSEAETEMKKVYYVTHAFRVKLKTSMDMGKILKKGQSLKIKNPGNMSYDVSDEIKKKATLEAYDKAMTDLDDKSKVILKNRGYELGDIKYLNDSSPYWDYGTNRNNTIFMQNSGSIQLDSRAEISIGEDIPFSVAQEMKISVSLTASYDILKLKK